MHHVHIVCNDKFSKHLNLVNLWFLMKFMNLKVKMLMKIWLIYSILLCLNFVLQCVCICGVYCL